MNALRAHALLALVLATLCGCGDTSPGESVDPTRPPHATWLTSRDVRDGEPVFHTHDVRELRIDPVDSTLTPRVIEWEFATSYGIWYARPGEFPANHEWFRMSGEFLATTPDGCVETRRKLHGLLDARGDTITSSVRDTFLIGLADCCTHAGERVNASFDLLAALEHYSSDTSALNSVQPLVPISELPPMEDDYGPWWPGLMW